MFLRINPGLIVTDHCRSQKRLQEAGTGADGQQTYQDAARTPQAMRHMTTKLGVEQVGVAYIYIYSNAVGQIQSLVITLTYAGRGLVWHVKPPVFECKDWVVCETRANP